MAKTRAVIQFEDYQYEHLRNEAFRRKISISSLIRQMVEKEMSGTPKRKNIERAMSFVGKKGCGKSDVARNHDEYLAGQKL